MATAATYDVLLNGKKSNRSALSRTEATAYARSLRTRSPKATVKVVKR